MPKRVAIVGGGIAGLSCLHELRKNRVEAELFEAGEQVGGRIKTFHHPGTGETVELGAGYFHEYYYGLLRLLDDVGLSDKVLPKAKGGTAIIKDDESIILKPLPMISAVARGKLRLEDIGSLQKLKSYSREHCQRGCQALVRFYQNKKGFVETLMEDLWFAQGYQERFSDFTSSLSPNVRNHVVRSVLRYQIFQEPEEISSTLGAAVLGAAAIPLKILNGGMSRLPDTLRVVFRKSIRLDTPVRRVYRDGKRLVIDYGGSDAAFDAVVIATPLPQASEISPAGVDGDLEYASANVFVVWGGLRKRYDKGDSIYIPDDQCGVLGMSRYGNNLFKVTQISDGQICPQDPKLERYFSYYDILARQEWRYALPKHPVRASYPSMQQAENVYLIGDHWFPCMEVAVDTGRKVADKITSSLS